MEEGLKPVTCVMCPASGEYRSTVYCEECCPAFIELRRPWRHWAIKCDPDKLIVVDKQ